MKYIDGEEGIFIYLNPTLVKEHSEDIYGYCRKDNSFPDQTTTDQFFDDQLFEAYRELGFSLGMMLCGEGQMDEQRLYDLSATLRANQAGFARQRFLQGKESWGNRSFPMKRFEAGDFASPLVSVMIPCHHFSDFVTIGD